MPDPRISVEAYSGLIHAIVEGTDEVTESLSAGKVRYQVIAGAGSPIPWGQVRPGQC